MAEVLLVVHFAFCLLVVIKSDIGTQGEISALNTPAVYSTDRSKAVVAVLVLLFVALWFYVLICSCVFQSF